MRKIVYTRPDGCVSIIIPAPKELLERVLGPLTQAEYEQHVKDRSIPADAINIREIDDSNIPPSREFRDAWVDVTPESTIDINCTRARDVQLEKLRAERNKRLAETDIEMTRALEDGDVMQIAAIKIKRQNLRNATQPLKELDTEGVINDVRLLGIIRELGKL